MILGFILKVSMETMKLKIVNVTNIKRHKYKIETETHTLKPLCHMGPLHPVLNIREAETAVRLQTSQTQGAKPKSKPAKHKGQNQKANQTNIGRKTKATKNQSYRKVQTANQIMHTSNQNQGIKKTEETCFGPKKWDLCS